MPGWWLSLSTDPFKPGRAQLLATHVIPGCASWRRPGIHNPCILVQHPNASAGSMDSGLALRAPRNDESYVSTNPVLDPLAAESLRPCGKPK
jgi:hypothetical protein